MKEYLYYLGGFALLLAGELLILAFILYK